MVKQYYWLKLKKDFFKDKRIKKLRMMAGGDTHTIIYLKMMLLAMDNDGVLIHEGVCDTFHEEIALEIDESPTDVELFILFAINQGLIEPVDATSFSLPEVKNCTGKESESAARVRRHRQKAIDVNADKLAPMLRESNEPLQCNKNVTSEKEIEIEIDKEKDTPTKRVLSGLLEETCGKPVENSDEPKKETHANLIRSFTSNEELCSSLLEFVEMRKLKKKPLTINALKRRLSELERLSIVEREQLLIVQQTVDHSWDSFYPLKKTMMLTPEELKKKHAALEKQKPTVEDILALGYPDEDRLIAESIINRWIEKDWCWNYYAWGTWERPWQQVAKSLIKKAKNPV